MCETYNDIPKHKKKSNRHIPKKADHKHSYVEVVGRVNQLSKPNDIFCVPYLKCTICGNLKMGDMFFTCKSDDMPANILDISMREDRVKSMKPELEVVDVYW